MWQHMAKSEETKEEVEKQLIGNIRKYSEL